MALLVKLTIVGSLFRPTFVSGTVYASSVVYSVHWKVSPVSTRGSTWSAIRWSSLFLKPTATAVSSGFTVNGAVLSAIRPSASSP
jgi:hypothetical protein